MSDATFQQRYGPWAVIAGGSDGIGAAFADQLAARGLHVALLARREATLTECAEGLRARHGARVRIVPVDLRDANAGETVAAATADLEVGLLVYNAGAPAGAGRFLDQPLETSLRMVELNCQGPLTLAHHFGGAMRERGRGGMIFLTSLAGLVGSSYQVAYCATKAFDHVLAEALWHDLHPAGIDVLSLVAGATRTPTAERMGLDFSKLSPADPEAGAMRPEDVAREGLEQLGRTPLWVAGEGNRAILPLVLSPDRASAIEIMSAGAAGIHELPHVPVTSAADD
jgi:short-subunit dehydrogenase